MKRCFVIQTLFLWLVTHGQSMDFEDESFQLTENGASSPTDFKPCPRVPQCDCWTHGVLTKDKTIVRCAKRNLTEVPTQLPNTTVDLDLKDNLIQSLGQNRFSNYPELKRLDLSTNKLKNIEQEAFEGLEQLEYLSLRNNSIRYNNTGFPPGVFKSLTNLETLNIQQNFTRNDYRGEDYTLEALSDLHKLNRLDLDAMPDKNLSEVFKNLTSLREIKFNGKYGRCLLWKLTPEFFPVNTSLTKITIRNCEMKKIQAKSFKHLTKLRFLDLSFNEELTFKILSNITDGMNPNIETLKLNRLHTIFGPCVILTKENLQGFRKLNLKELYAESNRITTMEDAAVKYIPRTLEIISIKDNDIAPDTYVYGFMIKQPFSNLRKLIMAQQYKNNYLDSKPFDPDLAFSKHPINYMYNKREIHLKPDQTKADEISSNIIKRHERHDFTASKADSKESKKDLIDERDLNEVAKVEIIKQKIADWMQGIPVEPPKNFTYLDASSMKIRLALRTFTLMTPNNLHVLDLSQNMYYAWVGPFVGFENLTTLNMSWNSCNYMNVSALQNMPSLKLLNLSKNYLDTSLNYDRTGKVFQNQGKLETLILSENRLRNLPKNIFSGLRNLKKLNIERNVLKTFETDLSHMYQLTELNLYDNQLETIEQSVRKVLDRQAYALNFTLNVERNNLKCDCANLDFLKWLSESPVKFKKKGKFVCYFKDRSYGNLTHIASIYAALERECANYTPIIISGTAALVLVIALTAAAVVYRYRWNLRYFYYMTWYKAKGRKSTTHGYAPIGTSDDEIKDVNVSYADEDSGFIRQKIHAELEVNRGLKLHLRHRDSPVDERFIPDNILDAIENSRKTLIILSRSYLKHKWCIFEMHMAGIKALKADTNMLCVLMLEEVSNRDLPLKIMRIIKDQQHIEYPGDDNLQDCFWDRLKAELTD